MARIIPARKWVGRLAGWGFAALLVVAASPGLRGAEAPVIKLPRLTAPDGRPIDAAPPPNGATVVIFYSSECPISNAYSPALNRLSGELPAGRVKFVGLCVDPDLSNADVLTHAKDFELKFAIARDREGTVARRLGATVTPEAFVIDGQGRLRYHGRIDDQFAARQKRNANPATNELRDAIRAVLEGREVASSFIASVGCPLPEPPREVLKPTYTRDVSVVLQKNCQECHRPGQVGPFPLETYEQARKRATDIADVADDRRMPPWKAAPQAAPRFKHDRSMSDADIAVLSVWAENGAPEGDPADLPAPVKFADDWKLGTPDLVLEMPQDFPVHASGDDIYRCFVIPTNLPEDMYVEAVEYRPGNRRVVHHILAYTDVSGAARKRDEADAGPGYSCFSGPGVQVQGDLGGWAPGNEASRLPEGVGRVLPRKADVIVQVHYHPDGKPETDRTRVGLHFAKKPVKQIMHAAAAVNAEFELPPGQSNIEVKAEWTAPVDLEAIGVTPHMHLLGRDIAMSVKYPDGRTEDLVKIPDWDFRWQNTYYFEKPVDLPKGTVLRVVSHFDNSERNPLNPTHPPKPVHWGEATTDEMCIGFISITQKGQDLTRPGAKDELREVLKNQTEEFHKEREKRIRARQKAVRS
ncbi:MAG: redoxin domain-containing protein [Isosphaeraceae bacterium]|nr:redoxin domain-containing protein [Isosphaeraceae bacterium]